jgi:hypothetical protein
LYVRSTQRWKARLWPPIGVAPASSASTAIGTPLRVGDPLPAPAARFVEERPADTYLNEAPTKAQRIELVQVSMPF